jgi:predicted enzyme related to lactoylglutathione lyase
MPRHPDDKGATVNRFCWMDLKTRDLPGTAAFFSTALGWRFAVDEDDWRKATKFAANGYQIGSVSDLANPVYPPGTPAHIAYYLAVDDVDRRTEAATANGARLVLPPFEAGDQGRMATLIDPVGAAFSLWQAHLFSGWEFPPHTAYAPHRMVLACDEPDQARHFYREMAGAPLADADFITTREAISSAPSGNSPSASTTWKASLLAYAATGKASSPGSVRTTAVHCG